jgi:hypothetical protein
VYWMRVKKVWYSVFVKSDSAWGSCCFVLPSSSFVMVQLKVPCRRHLSLPFPNMTFSRFYPIFQSNVITNMRIQLRMLLWVFQNILQIPFRCTNFITVCNKHITVVSYQLYHSLCTKNNVPEWSEMLLSREERRKSWSDVRAGGH